MMIRAIEVFGIDVSKNKKLAIGCIETLGGVRAILKLYNKVLRGIPLNYDFLYYLTTFSTFLILVLYLAFMGYNLFEVIKDRKFLDTFRGIF